jgi:hypothetical protein
MFCLVFFPMTFKGYPSTTHQVPWENKCIYTIIDFMLCFKLWREILQNSGSGLTCHWNQGSCYEGETIERILLVSFLYVSYKTSLIFFLTWIILLLDTSAINMESNPNLIPINTPEWYVHYLVLKSFSIFQNDFF